MSNELKKLTREGRRRSSEHRDEQWAPAEQRAPGLAAGTGRAASDGPSSRRRATTTRRTSSWRQTTTVCQRSSGGRRNTGRRDELRPARSAWGFCCGSLCLTPHGKGDAVREGENEGFLFLYQWQLRVNTTKVGGDVHTLGWWGSGMNLVNQVFPAPSLV